MIDNVQDALIALVTAMAELAENSAEIAKTVAALRLAVAAQVPELAQAWNLEIERLKTAPPSDTSLGKVLEMKKRLEPPPK